ncbi:MAG: Trk system potassium transporter TrkA [Clostridia bacterium]|nr:Trk system potassium transporter TrkA [Clostridia bacterium]
MNIVIIGAGKIGANLTKFLALENHNITVVDLSRKVIENLVNDCDVIGYVGNGAAFKTQEETGVAKCDCFIAVTGNDELNIMSCMLAAKTGAKKTIARVRSAEYSDQLLFMQNKLGVDLLINPEFETALEIARIIDFPSATKIETFAKGRIDLAEIVVTEDSPLANLPLKELRATLKVSILICAVKRGDQVIIPSGNFVIKAGDRLHFTASRNTLPGAFKELGLQKKKIKSVLIVGGSRTSFYLAKVLQRAGKFVKLIELNEETAASLESALDGVSIICGDGTDTTLLTEEGIQDYDAVVALTNIDEENIILSLYAAKQGVRKTVCKINRDPLARMTSDILADCSVVCPKTNTASIILRYVRAVENAGSDSIKTLYQILDGGAEAAEFIAGEDSKIVGTPLRNLKLKEGNIIACVSSGKTVIIPDGNTIINPGDSVIVIANSAHSSLSEILKD